MCEMTDSRHESKGSRASGFEVMFKIRTSLILTQKIRFLMSERFKDLRGIRADIWECTREKDVKDIFLISLCTYVDLPFTLTPLVDTNMCITSSHRILREHMPHFIVYSPFLIV
jgi:hypothetical protein